MSTTTNLPSLFDAPQSAPSGRRDDVGASIQKGAQAVVDHVAALHQAAPEGMREELAEIMTGLGRIFSVAEHSRQTASQHRANLDLHPDGRKARSTEALEQGEQAIGSETARLLALATVTSARFTEAALKVKDRERAALDAESALRVAKDPAGMFQHMAQHDENDDVVALLAGEWGRRTAHALGIDPKLTEATRTLALERLTNTFDPARKRDAELALKTRGLASVIQPGASLARDAMRRP